LIAPHSLHAVVERPGPLRIPARFLLDRGAYGGVVLAALVQRVEAAAEHPLRSLSVNLCGITRCEVDAEVSVIPLRLGSNTASYSVTVKQGDHWAAHGAAFTGAPRAPDLNGQWVTPPPLPPWSTVPVMATDGVMPPFADLFEYRPCHGGAMFSGGSPIAGGYLAIRESPATLDKIAMAALIDAWWPALFVPAQDHRPMATTAIQVLFFEDDAVAVDGPCILTKEVRRVGHGYAVEDDALWSADGRLLAVAQQMIAVIR
jgi:acyl-CoA thioesterase